MAPGFTGYFGGGRPEPYMIQKLFSTLVPKDRVPIEIVVGEQRLTVSVPVADSFVALSLESEASAMNLPAAVTVPLIRLAVARSGDKGDHANIGVAAREPVYLPYIESALTTAAVRRYFAHVLKGGEQGRVERWHLPGHAQSQFSALQRAGRRWCGQPACRSTG